MTTLEDWAGDILTTEEDGDGRLTIMINGMASCDLTADMARTLRSRLDAFIADAEGQGKLEL